MNIFKAIGHGIKVAAIAVAHGFESLFGKQAAQDFAKASLHMLQSAAGRIAVQVVSALEDQIMPGSKKHALAFSQILSAAKDAGLSLKDSEINLLIELVVTAMRQHFTLPAADTGESMPIPEGV